LRRLRLQKSRFWLLICAESAPIRHCVCVRSLSLLFGFESFTLLRGLPVAFTVFGGSYRFFLFSFSDSNIRVDRLRAGEEN
jgi:hypothetical protein